MCDGSWFSSQFQNWQPFSEAANVVARGKGFAATPSSPGVYCLRVIQAPTVDLASIEAAYLGSPLYQAFSQLDAASEALFDAGGLGAGWGWTCSRFAAGRVARVRSIQVDAGGTLSCPIVYFGKSNKLVRRMRELVSLGHTVNHPLWALMHSGWTFDLGWAASHDQTAEENRLKEEYRRSHAGQLAPLMDR